jgi:hypothetical protein
MAEFHFVEDYERLVQSLIASHPIDEAMALAVGGNYEAVGEIERDMLRHAGLRDGMSLVDLGCGSGRLTCALGRSMQIEYPGTDIVQALPGDAATRVPPHDRFRLHRAQCGASLGRAARLRCGGLHQRHRGAVGRPAALAGRGHPAAFLMPVKSG